MTSIDDPPQENSSHSRQESTDTLDNSANETGDASSLGGKTTSEAGAEADQPQPQKRHIEKSFFFSVEDVQYNRMSVQWFLFQIIPHQIKDLHPPICSQSPELKELGPN